MTVNYITNGVVSFISESLHSASLASTLTGSLPRTYVQYDVRHDVNKQSLPLVAVYCSEDVLHMNCGKVWHKGKLNLDCYYTVPGNREDLLNTDWSGMQSAAYTIIKSIWRETVSPLVTGSIIREQVIGLDGINPIGPVRFSYYQTKVDSTPFYGFSIPIQIDWYETEESESETLETIYAIQTIEASGSFVTGSISELSASCDI